MRVREIKDWYVDSLMNMLLDEGDEGITASLLVIPKETSGSEDIQLR